MSKSVKNQIITFIVVVILYIGGYFFWKILIDRYTIATIVVIVVIWIYRFFRDASQADSWVDREDLKRRGLSTEDIKNISFVKYWEGINSGGKAKYIIIDGAIFYGFSAGFLLFLITAFTFRKGIFSNGPGEVFTLIGYCLLIGAAAGLAINTIQWKRNGRRFKRLTQPTEKDLLSF
jgi:hypothetical protein